VPRYCVKCGKKYRLERHHVTYKPEQIALLCRSCHRLITTINFVASRKYKTNKETKREFTNFVRLLMWTGFLKGVVRLKEV
jgi:hypothetical protein